MMIKLVKKAKEELEQSYKDWQNGILELKGDSNQIEIYFKYTIETFKNNIVSDKNQVME